MKKESGRSESTEVILPLQVVYEEGPPPAAAISGSSGSSTIHESRSTQQPIQTASLKKLALVASKITLVQNTHLLT